MRPSNPNTVLQPGFGAALCVDAIEVRNGPLGLRVSGFRVQGFSIVSLGFYDLGPDGFRVWSLPMVSVAIPCLGYPTGS